MSDITQIGSNITGNVSSVSINGSGNIVAIGDPSNNKTKIYEWNGTSWTQLGQNIDGENSSDQSGYSVSLNSQGNIVAIGAIYNSGGSAVSGHVRIYKYDNDTDTWNQLGQDIDGKNVYDFFGASVSLNSQGNIVAIGGPQIFENGLVRIYEYNSVDTWVQLGQDIDGEAIGNQLGSSVSLNNEGNIVAIGAYAANSNTSGHTRIYEYNSSSNTWSQLGQDIDGEAADDLSGSSVSLNSIGNIVAIGATYNDGISGIKIGHTRIFQYNGTDTWIQLGQDIDGEANFDESGYSVSLNSQGNIVAIGAPYNDGGGSDSGHTRIYQYNNDTNVWNQFGIDIDGEASDDKSGYSVSLNNQGDIVVIGAKVGQYSQVYQLDIDLNLDDLINSDISMVPPVVDATSGVTVNKVVTGNTNIASFTADDITVPSGNPSIMMLRLDAFDLAGQKLNLTGLTGNNRIWIEVEYPNYNPFKNYEFLKYDEVTLKQVTSPDYPVELKPVDGKPNTLGGYLTGLSVIGLNEKSNTKKKVVPKKKYIYLFNNTTGCKRRVLC